MSAIAVAPAFDFVGFFRAVEQGIADAKANKAPPTKASLTAAGFADFLTTINASLPAAAATLRAHQGELTGVAHVLAVLAKAGVPYAADIEAALLSYPGLLEAAEKWLPVVLPFIRFGDPFAAAPNPPPGMNWRAGNA